MIERVDDPEAPCAGPLGPYCVDLWGAFETDRGVPGVHRSERGVYLLDAGVVKAMSFCPFCGARITGVRVVSAERTQIAAKVMERSEQWFQRVKESEAMRRNLGPDTAEHAFHAMISTQAGMLSAELQTMAQIIESEGTEGEQP